MGLTLRGSSGGGSATLPKVASTVSASGAAVVAKHNPVDASGATRAISLPTGQAEGTEVSVEKVDTSANLVNVTGSIRGVGSSTLGLSWQYESIMLRADSTGSWWPVAGHKTKTALDTAFAGQVTPKPIRWRAIAAHTNTMRVFGSGLRRWGIVRNDHATNSVTLGYSTNGDADFNTPTMTITLLPGQEYVESGQERSLFVTPAVASSAYSVTIEYEKGA